MPTRLVHLLVDAGDPAGLARLRRLGARLADVGQGDVPWVMLAHPRDVPWVMLAHPRGNESCVLSPR